MTQLTHQSYLLIEDAIDIVGQKYRVQQLVRGGILFVTGLIVGGIVCSLLAHFAGAGWGARLILLAWIAWSAGSLWQWIIRPLLIRPQPMHVARMVEQRLGGLHNGLTNAILLTHRGDLQNNTWIEPILDEILLSTKQIKLDGAIRFGELRRMGTWSLIATAISIFTAILFSSQVAHGWQQIFSPATFVPQQGEMVIDQLLPGDVTLVAGQPLEITAIAHGPRKAIAKIVFDRKLPTAELTPITQDDQSLRYLYRVEHVDQTLRYRLEVGRTQTPWYTVTTVAQIKPVSLSATLTPPAYTRHAASTVAIDLESQARPPLRIVQGGTIGLDLAVDVPANAAMLQLGSAAPSKMRVLSSGTHFSGAQMVTANGPASILLTEPTGQIIAQMPQPALAVEIIPDAPPSIEMKFPAQDTTIAPSTSIKIQAILRDDYGLRQVRILVSDQPSAPLAKVYEAPLTGEPTSSTLEYDLKIPEKSAVHGQSIRVQVQVSDNRQIADPSGALGPQTTSTRVYEIKFDDPKLIAQQEQEQFDALREALLKMLQTERTQLDAAMAYKTGDKTYPAHIQKGQAALRDMMVHAAQTITFSDKNRIVQKTLLAMAYGPVQQTIDLSDSLSTELVAQQQIHLNGQLMSRQREVITTLENLLAILGAPTDPSAEQDGKKGDLPNERQAMEQLNKDLKDYIAQQRQILDQTANLAKKPVDNWDDNDRKTLDDLLMAQEKLDNFMQQKISDYATLAEQDMANPALLKELLEVYSEVTMAKDALKKDAVEVAVSLEDSGVELAQELSNNIEKWLSDLPDRIKWTMEDPLEKTEPPMAELPTELEDLIGELMEQEEDLFDEMEDTNANWADSLDRGAGWDAMDGPIANMSAKGVTGNALPNNNEMSGRSGEGRTGKSQGEMVEDTATGKGGRRTPTRLDPTAFQKGQINDQSKDPVGGATGGGKLSGQGGEGLEGPVPPAQQEALKRLAQKQAQIRNTAERIQLQYRLNRYDNFQLEKSIAMMRRVESDLESNRYQNALRRRDVLLEGLASSKLLAGGEVHVQRDTTPTPTARLQDEINTASAGELPPAWSKVLQTYYEKLSAQ